MTMPKKVDLARKLDKEGYVLLKSVFSAQEISRLRATAEKVTATPSKYEGDVDNHARFSTARGDIYARYPDFQWVLFHEPLINGLKQILGPRVVFIPEQPLHKGFYANWHRDTASPRKNREQFYFKRDFRIVQVAVYLQGNSEIHGGGLDVVPGSHREVFLEWLEDLGNGIADRAPLPFNRGRHRLRQLTTLPARFGGLFRKPVTLPIAVGDVVAFDLRIRHRATRPVEDIDHSKHPGKFGMFMVCSADNERAYEYYRWLREVSRSPAVVNHQFPEALKAEAARNSVILL